MDPLKTAHLPAQDLLNQTNSQNSNNQEFLINAAAADDCGFDILSMFDTATTAASQYEQQNEILSDNEQKLLNGISLENAEILNEKEKASINTNLEQLEMVSYMFTGVPREHVLA